MVAALQQIDPVAILACVGVGQVFLTLWFVVLFGEPWARVYGAADRKQHTREIPGYTYAIGAACVLLLAVGLATLQVGFGVQTVAGAVGLGLFVAVVFAVATALPGYAFLKRWRAFALAVGSQASLIVVLSLVLALWPS